MPKILHYLRCAMELITAEIELLNLRINHPELFTSPAPVAPVAPLATWNGTIAELLEYIIPLQIDGKLAKPLGEPMAYSDAVALAKKIFGIEVSSAYDRKTKLLTRKRNGTPFIDRMRQVLRDAIEKMYQ